VRTAVRAAAFGFLSGLLWSLALGILGDVFSSKADNCLLRQFREL
jgi:hypothetical protein